MSRVRHMFRYWYFCSMMGDGGTRRESYLPAKDSKVASLAKYFRKMILNWYINETKRFELTVSCWEASISFCPFISHHCLCFQKLALYRSRKLYDKYWLVRLFRSRLQRPFSSDMLTNGFHHGRTRLKIAPVKRPNNFEYANREINRRKILSYYRLRYYSKLHWVLFIRAITQGVTIKNSVCER